MTAPVDPVPNPPTGRPIVFYSPHQDDETLFMGQIIAHHALAGREVHVVLCSSGATSAARDQINGQATSGFWGGFHYPAREGYDPLSPALFAAERTEEQAAACAQLGVPAARVHTGPADLELTGEQLPEDISVAWGEQIMTSWASYFTSRGFDQVGHYTMWWGDTHADHAALGQALQNRRSLHPQWFGDARWLVKPEQAGAAHASAYGLPASLTAQIKLMTKRAGWCYRAWQPAAGAFAIGYHSVQAYFTALDQTNGPNYIVAPTSP